MEKQRIIDIKEDILARNKLIADTIRDTLRKENVLMLNIMGSPGSGKTSLIRRSIEFLKSKYRIAVLKADLYPEVDLDRIAAICDYCIPVKLGGSCAVNASMIKTVVDSLPLDKIDLIFLENIGNLICPAESDAGASKNILVLSVPEGDDKALKFPHIFSISDALVISKTDYLESANFKIVTVKDQASILNREIHIVSLSCKNDDGMEDWIHWIEEEIQSISDTGNHSQKSF